jgi:outer membrane protein assembly factor BamB
MKYFNAILFLLAISITAEAQQEKMNWNIFRGSYDLCGSASSEIPFTPVLLWSLPTGTGTKSSPVISDGAIYFGNEKGILYSVTSEGNVRWKKETGSPVEAPPLVYENRIFVGSSDGTFRSFDKISGKLLWSYSADNQIIGSANIWIAGKRTGIVLILYQGS